MHSRVTSEITGPEVLSFRDSSDTISQLYNVPIEFEIITPEELYRLFDSWGIPRGYTEDAGDPAMTYGSDELVTAYLAFEQGYHAILSHHVKFIAGQEPIPPRAVLAEARIEAQQQG
jgi:NAD(P)H dehydrogenase (quinone)